MYESLKDSLNFFSKLSFKKISNYVLLLFTYYASRILRKNFHYGMPTSASIEPTTSCNLQCPECPSGQRSFYRNTGMLPFENYKNYINQLKKNLTYLNLYFQGEPFLNKNFCNLVKYADESGIYTSTSTNAHFINTEMADDIVKSGLDRLIISIDGASEHTYVKYRKGGALSKVLDGTMNIVNARKKSNSTKPFIIWQFIVFKHNEHELGLIKNLASEYKVDKLKIKTAQIYNFDENNEELIPENSKYSRYINESGFKIKNRLMNHCWRMWQGCVITWDGDVVPCCFDKDASHKIGKISENNFYEIWNSNDYNNFRNSILNSRKDIDICRNCSEGSKIWI